MDAPPPDQTGAAREPSRATRQDAEPGTLEARAPISKRAQDAPLRRLIFQRGDSADSPWDHYELPHINTSLSLGTDVTGACVQERVMPVVLAKAEAEKKAQGKEVTRYTRIAERWWQFYDYRPGTIAAINSVPRWIALSRTSKRPIFEFISHQIHADSKLMVFAFADDYSFGILSSDLHWQWTVAKGSTLKGDQNYTSDTVFDTFPWPQSPTRGQIAEAAAAAVRCGPCGAR